MPDQEPPNARSESAVSGLSIYLCAALMILPTLLGGIFCMTVLMPKLVFIQHVIESLPDERSHVAAQWNGYSKYTGIGLQVAIATLVPVFTFLELRVSKWKRVRHWFVLGSACLVNFCFVVFVIWIAITATATGPLAGFKSAQKRQLEASKK